MLEIERASYTEGYFRQESESSTRAAYVMVPLILEAVQAKSVLDVGCGVGAFLRCFYEYG